MTWNLRTVVYGGWMGPWDDITDMISGLTLRSELNGGLQSIEFDIGDKWVEAILARWRAMQ
jgi:hypothetical protein